MKSGKRSLRDGLYLLPSLLTLTNLYLGYLSIVASVQGRFRTAALLIIIAAVTDGLDGIVARAAHVGSDFGIQLDSLSDAVSFGVATPILLYFWGLRLDGRIGVFFSFLFLTAGVLRLARYNVRTKGLPDRKSYQGLTVPSAAMFMASLVFAHPRPLEARELGAALALLTTAVALCMVSTLKYRNFLNISLRRRIDIRTALMLAVVLAGLLFATGEALVALFSINVLSGPVGALVGRAAKALRRRKAAREAA
jgi:CDP-diacylglycerol--serine O-phosphatidyltransferase